MTNYWTTATLLVAFLVTGCANIPAGSSDEVLRQHAQKKECYIVDSLSRHIRGTLPTSAGLGVLGALVPGASVAAAVLAGTNAVSDMHGQPANCNMTANDALDAALKMSHLERGATLTKGRSNELEFIVRFDGESDGCSNHPVALRDFSTGKSFKRQIKVCSNDGVIQIHK
jgi:hypothetical protein